MAAKLTVLFSLALAGVGVAAAGPGLPRTGSVLFIWSVTGLLLTVVTT